MESMEATQISLRPAGVQDFDYCESLYFVGMKRIIQELNLNMAVQVASFRQQWELAQVRIITFDGADVGWLQSTTRGDTLFLAQLFVDGSFQRRGIGSEVVSRLIGEATRARQSVTLGVVKINPALRLYERLGFRVTHEDDHKFYMRRDPGTEAQISNQDSAVY
jgi:ribosomal protein S18 acetylase RimI-like enzyme